MPTLQEASPMQGKNRDASCLKIVAFDLSMCPTRNCMVYQDLVFKCREVNTEENTEEKKRKQEAIEQVRPEKKIKPEKRALVADSDAEGGEKPPEIEATAPAGCIKKAESIMMSEAWIASFEALTATAAEPCMAAHMPVTRLTKYTKQLKEYQDIMEIARATVCSRKIQKSKIALLSNATDLMSKLVKSKDFIDEAIEDASL
jgi:hypothetical protein